MSPTATVNRLLSALLALVLILGGLLVATEIVLAQSGRRPWVIPHPTWAGWLRERTWDSDVIRLGLAGLALVGLLLLVLAVRRGRPRAVVLTSRAGGPAGVRTTASRRGLDRTLTAAARRVDGVSGARARVGRRSVSVVAETPSRAGDTKQQVTDAVARRLAELGIIGTLRPRVTISRRTNR